jgi:IS4 transposase
MKSFKLKLTKYETIKIKKITYYDREHKRTFEFISNLFEFRADTIAALYKLRWQIELLFKQIKFSTKIFLETMKTPLKFKFIVS